MTAAAPRAYEIARRFKSRGVPVVLGGMHPTFRPDEALCHANAVCVGDAEGIWPRIVRDARAEGLGLEVQDKSQAAPAVKKALLKTGAFDTILTVSLPFHRHRRRKIRIKLELDSSPPLGSHFETHYINFQTENSTGFTVTVKDSYTKKEIDEANIKVYDTTETYCIQTKCDFDIDNPPNKINIT